MDQLLRTSSAQQGPDSSQEFREGERLRQKLVRAGIETGHLGLHGVARCQQQHGSDVSFGPNTAAERETIELGQHDVEDQKIVRITHGQRQPFFAIGHKVYRILLFLQPFADELSEVQIVFNQQYSHGLPCSYLLSDQQGQRSGIDRAAPLTEAIMTPLDWLVTAARVVRRLGNLVERLFVDLSRPGADPRGLVAAFLAEAMGA